MASISLLPECNDDRGEVVADVGDLEVKLLHPLLSLVSRLRKNWFLMSLKNRKQIIRINIKNLNIMLAIDVKT